MAGIDQQIQTKVDAYRNNPGALQQRYQQNQELLDLLALQKLKSEKDAAARDIQMQMAQDPQTIKQQRERELVDRTKQDMAQQTAGIMQQRQAQQQKNMQQVAKQGAASPQAVQGIQQGLGSLARQVKPQIAQMAAGGIVGYAAGGITQADIDAYRRSGGQSRRSRTQLTDEQIRTILERTAGPDTSSMMQTRRGLRRDPSAQPITTAAPIATLAQQKAEQEDSTGVLTSGTTTEIVSPKVGAAGTQITKADTERNIEEAPANEKVEQGLPTITAPEFDLSGLGTRGKSIIDASGLGSIPSAANAETTARESADTYLGREEKATKYGQLTDRLAAYDKRMSDPRKSREEQISAFLRNTAGGGSFGQTMAAGSQGMANERTRQEAGEEKRLKEIIGLETAAITVDTELGKAGLTAGTAAADRADANRRQVAATMAQMTASDIQLAIAEAEKKLSAEQSNVRNRLDQTQNNARNLLDQMQIESTENLRMAIQNEASTDRLMDIYQTHVDKMSGFVQGVIENDDRLTALQNKAEKTGEQKDIDAYNARLKNVIIQANTMMNAGRNGGMLGFEETLRARLEGMGVALSGPTTRGSGMGSQGIELDPVTDALVDQYQNR
jgi:putative sterol carrier protein